MAQELPLGKLRLTVRKVLQIFRFEAHFKQFEFIESQKLYEKWCSGLYKEIKTSSIER